MNYGKKSLKNWNKKENVHECWVINKKFDEFWLQNFRNLSFKFPHKFQTFPLNFPLPLSNIPWRATKSSSSSSILTHFRNQLSLVCRCLRPQSPHCIHFHALNHQQTPHTNPPCSTFHSTCAQLSNRKKKLFWLWKTKLFHF